MLRLLQTIKKSITLAAISTFVFDALAEDHFGVVVGLVGIYEHGRLRLEIFYLEVWS